MTTKKNKNIPATDKTRSVINQIGGRNYSDHEREQNDFYATSPEAIDRLFTEWQPPVEVPIWEPACGTGHLSLRLEELGYKVKSTDLIDRGFGEGGVDFLWQSDKWEGNIITNPPYDQATDFILHSLDLVQEGAYVAMFLKTLFVDSQSRYERLFRKTPPLFIYQNSRRIECGLGGNFRGTKGAMPFAWFVWQKGNYKGTNFKWLR